MHVAHVCGCRGLGDILSSIPRIIYSLKQDTHLIFHYPPDRGYDVTIKTIMDELVMPGDINVTYEVVDYDYTVSIKVANQIYGEENFKKTWFFTASGGRPQTHFKTTWERNTRGPIGLAINNENTHPDYPYPDKWFSQELDDMLRGLADGENYILLGKPLTVKENIDVMAKCRYVVGTDGAWAHCAKYVQIPYYLVRNNLSMDILMRMHRDDKYVKVVETHDLFNYI